MSPAIAHTMLRHTTLIAALLALVALSVWAGWLLCLHRERKFYDLYRRRTW